MSLRPDLLSIARQVTNKSRKDALRTESEPHLSTEQDKALAAAARGRVMRLIAKPEKRKQKGHPEPSRPPPPSRAPGPAPLSVVPDVSPRATTPASQGPAGDETLTVSPQLGPARGGSAVSSRSQSQTPSASLSSQRQRTKLRDELTAEDVRLKLLVDETRKSQALTQPARSQASPLFVSDGAKLASYSQQYSHSPMDALTVSQEDSQSHVSTTRLGVMEAVNITSSAAK